MITAFKEWGLRKLLRISTYVWHRIKDLALAVHWLKTMSPK